MHEEVEHEIDELMTQNHQIVNKDLGDLGITIQQTSEPFVLDRAIPETILEQESTPSPSRALFKKQNVKTPKSTIGRARNNKHNDSMSRGINRNIKKTTSSYDNQ